MSQKIEKNSKYLTTATSKKRFKSTKTYLDKLQENYSKINVVRIDLSYKQESSEKVTLTSINKDLKRMLNNRRSKPSIFEDNIGYVIKREHGEDKGLHLHAVFLFDGQKVQKDTHKATQIGNYWEESITKGEGLHYNCNKKQYKRVGTGMIDHKNSDKRKILDNDVIAYMCKDGDDKDSQSIKPLKNNVNDRAFTRGTIPKDKSKAGRPRKEKK